MSDEQTSYKPEAIVDYAYEGSEYPDELYIRMSDGHITAYVWYKYLDKEWLKKKEGANHA